MRRAACRSDQGGEGAAERRRVDAFAGARRRRDVVGAAPRCQAVQEPERLLAARQRQIVLAGRRRGPARRLAFHITALLPATQPLQDEPRQLGGAGAGEEVGQGDLDPGPLRDALPQLDRRQRVEAQVGERRPGRDARRRHAGRPRRLAAHPSEEEGLALAGVQPEQRRGDGKRWLQPRERFEPIERRWLGRSRQRLQRRRRFHLRARAPQRREAAVEIGGPAGLAPHLAARGPGQGRGAQEDHLVHPRLVLLGDRAPHRLGDRRRRVRLSAAQIGLARHHQPLLAIGLDREGGARPRPQRRVSPLDGPLDVLRIVIAPAQDDEVLPPPGDEQLAAGEKAEVARAQERAGRRLVRQAGAEVGRGLLGLAPVPRCHAGAGDPDLAHPVGGAAGARRGIDDGDLLPHPRAAGADQLGAASFRGGGSSPGPLHPVLLERLGGERLDPRRLPGGAPGDEERRLGQAVARIEGLAPEAAGREGAGEAVERRRAHRLGAVEGHPPARQIELPPVRGGDPPGAEGVGEVGAAAGGRPVAADRAQPAHRLLQEGERRHEDARRAGVERLQDGADQPHVVVERQPADDDRLRGLRERPPDRLLVVQQVGVADDDPLGSRGGARGVLEERRRLAARRRRLPRRIGGRQLVDRQPGESREAGDLGAQPAQPRQARGDGQDGGGPRVAGDRGEARQAAPRRRRIGGHRDRAGVEAAQEGGDEVEAGREEQHRPLARQAGAVEPGAEGARRAVELGIGQPPLLLLAVAQEGVGEAIGSRRRPLPQDGAEILRSLCGLGLRHAYSRRRVKSASSFAISPSAASGRSKTGASGLAAADARSRRYCPAIRSTVAAAKRSAS